MYCGLVSRCILELRDHEAILHFVEVVVAIRADGYTYF